MQILTRRPADARTVSVISERKRDSVIRKDLHLIDFLISNKIDDHGVDVKGM